MKDKLIQAYKDKIVVVEIRLHKVFSMQVHNEFIILFHKQKPIIKIDNEFRCSLVEIENCSRKLSSYIQKEDIVDLEPLLNEILFNLGSINQYKIINSCISGDGSYVIKQISIN